MITIINFLLLLLTFGAIEIADITYTYVDEYTYETQDGITLIELFGEHNTYVMPNLAYQELQEYTIELLTLTDIENTKYSISFSGVNNATDWRLLVQYWEDGTNISNSGVCSSMEHSSYYNGTAQGCLWPANYTYLTDYFTTTADTVKIGLYSENKTGVISTSELQVEKNDYITEYFPYGEYKYISNDIDNAFDIDSNSDGLADYWVTINSSIYDFTDGVQTIETNGSGSMGIRQYNRYTYEAGDIYYFSWYGYSNCTGNQAHYFYSASGNTTFYNASITTTNTHYTAIDTIDYDSTDIRFTVSGTASAGTYQSMSNIYVINLSEVFGIGNEPTKTQMDTWYDLYETAITTDQHEYTYTLNTLTTTEQVLIFVYAGFWFILIKALRGVL